MGYSDDRPVPVRYRADAPARDLEVKHIGDSGQSNPWDIAKAYGTAMFSVLPAPSFHAPAPTAEHGTNEPASKERGAPSSVIATAPADSFASPAAASPAPLSTSPAPSAGTVSRLS